MVTRWLVGVTDASSVSSRFSISMIWMEHETICKVNFSKIAFKNTIRVSKNFDPDQTKHFQD